MKKTNRYLSMLSLLLVVAFGLMACDSNSTAATTPAANTAVAAAATATSAPAMAVATATTGAATDAKATATTAPVAPAAATDVPPAEVSDAACANAGKVDVSKVKKIAIESGATLRFSGWGNTSEQQVTREQLCRFKQAYPTIKVIYEPIPDNYESKLKTQISSGTEADVFYVNPPLTDLLVSSKKLLKLNDYMSEANMKKSDFFESLINIFSRGDDVYGLPKDFGSIIVFYNQDIVAKATGAKAPPADGNWTWDDYSAFAKSLVSGTGESKVFGTMHQPDYARWLPFALANGAKVLSADGKKSAINSAEAKAALDWYYGLYKDGTAGESKLVSAGWPGEAFGKQKAGFVIEGGWMIPFLKDSANGFNVKWSAAPLPKSPKGTYGDLLFTNAYSARADSKFPKAAAALVTFLSGPVNQEAVLITGFAVPTLKGYESNAYFTDHGAEKALYATASFGTVDYYGPATGVVQKTMSDAMNALYLGKVDTAGALKQMEDGINAALADI